MRLDHQHTTWSGPRLAGQAGGLGCLAWALVDGGSGKRLEITLELCSCRSPPVGCRPIAPPAVLKSEWHGTDDAKTSEGVPWLNPMVRAIGCRRSA